MGPRVFGVGALLYAVAVMVATVSPGPGAWGLHLAAFLDPTVRPLVFTLLGTGVAEKYFGPRAASGPAGSGVRP